ncbi:ribonuclease H-like domain-containing protein [Aspergillus filifer]
MSKGKQAIKTPSPLYYCHTCQKNFVDANALRMHYRSSKAHQGKVPSAISTQKSRVLSPLSKTKGLTCGVCDREFVSKAALRSHKRDSQNHRDRANAKAKAPSRRNELSSIAKTKAGPNADGTASGKNLADIEEPKQLVDYYYSYLEDQIWSGPLPVQLKLPLLLSLGFQTSLECQGEDAKAEGCKLLSVPSPQPPEVPEPWSSIPLSERDEILAALKAQCHSLECLKEEGFWIKTPSAVDIDMTRKCRDCGVSKRKLNTAHATESVCRFHPARKPFQRGIIRGRGPGVPKKARCINCAPSSCIVLPTHTFAAPNAKLSKMTPTPPPVPNSNGRAAIVLDCEMVGVLENTLGGYGCEQSEVVRVVAVDFLTGEVLLDTYVSPLGRVISWRTKYSGVNASILAEKKREGRVLSGGWQSAREAICRFIDADTILIGHGLNNDLNVLGMVHSRVVDSAILTRLVVDGHCQRHWKLRTLAREFLGLSIQTGDGKDGHDCVEDTFAAREVVLWCLLNSDKLQAWAAVHTTTGCGEQGFPSAQPYLSHHYQRGQK